MFTAQTISALRALQDLGYKADEWARQTNQDQCTATRNTLLSPTTIAALADSGRSLVEQADKALLEGLRQARPSFDDTNYFTVIDYAIEAYTDDLPAGKNRANTVLSVALKSCDKWLDDIHEASLPRQKYNVSSAFGMFEIEATSPEKARLAAAAQHYNCAVGALGESQLRNFATGVLA